MHSDSDSPDYRPSYEKRVRPADMDSDADSNIHEHYYHADDFAFDKAEQEHPELKEVWKGQVRQFCLDKEPTF